MGTHISRVKSVDLDSWTDEQTASMIKWGNTRANKYVESIWYAAWTTCSRDILDIGKQS